MTFRPACLGLLALLAQLPVPARAGDAERSTLMRVASEAAAAGQSAIAGRDGWLFLAAELRHLGVGRFWGPDAERAGRAPKAEWRDPLPAILDFRDQLAKAGIELLLVPVPPKAAVVPGAVAGLEPGAATRRLDAADAEFYALLRAKHLEVLDLQPDLAGRAAEQAFCKTDSHWSGRGIDVAAARIAERVKRADWYAAVPKQRFDARQREHAIQGDLARMLGGTPAKETLPLRFVSLGAGAAATPVAPSRESPLLLLGDSHTLVFHAGGDMHAQGAGLPDQLARELGFAVDLVGVRGSGATPARINLARRKDGLAGKRLVVWCFGARELSEAAQGWAKVPVLR